MRDLYILDKPVHKLYQNEGLNKSVGSAMQLKLLS